MPRRRGRRAMDVRTCGLTFDLSGVPKARPLEGRVRALVDVKPIGCHRAELMLLDLGLVFQVGLARTKRDSGRFRG